MPGTGDVVELERPHHRLAAAGQGARRDPRGRRRLPASSTSTSAAPTPTPAARVIEVTPRRRGGTRRACSTQLQVHGANRVDAGRRRAGRAPTSTACCPPGFYATTNLPTLGADRRPLARGREPGDGLRRSSCSADDARACAPCRCTACAPATSSSSATPACASPRRERPRGAQPVRVHGLGGRVREAEGAARAAGRRRASAGASEAGGKVLAVCGPAVVHTGAAPDIARLVREGWIDVLFAGNGFATHDIESNVLGTSLGVSVHEGAAGRARPHQPPARDQRGAPPRIDRRRRRGRLHHRRRDVRVRHADGVPFVLGGSVRDDGPLPDVLHRRRRRGRRHARPTSAASPSRSCWRRRCTPSPPATCCPPASRPTASTSTRPWSPSSPTAAATRRSASSPTSASSSRDLADSTLLRRWLDARLGAAVPHVPAGALRRALRDQPVDAPRGRRRPRPGPRAVGGARRRAARRRRRRRDAARRARRARHGVHRQRRHRQRHAVRAVALPPSASASPRSPLRHRVVRGARLRGSTRCPTACRHEGAGDALPFGAVAACRATAAAATPPATPTCRSSPARRCARSS